jgi:hypothetical protein
MLLYSPLMTDFDAFGTERGKPNVAELGEAQGESENIKERGSEKSAFQEQPPANIVPREEDGNGQYDESH